MSYTNRTCKGKTCQGHSLYCAVIAVKENVFSCTHEQLKLVKENCWKNLFIVHTSKESYQATCQGNLGRLCGPLVMSSLTWISFPLFIHAFNTNLKVAKLASNAVFPFCALKNEYLSTFSGQNSGRRINHNIRDVLCM